MLSLQLQFLWSAKRLVILYGSCSEGSKKELEAKEQ